MGFYGCGNNIGIGTSRNTSGYHIYCMYFTSSSLPLLIAWIVNSSKSWRSIIRFNALIAASTICISLAWPLRGFSPAITIRTGNGTTFLHFVTEDVRANYTMVLTAMAPANTRISSSWISFTMWPASRTLHILIQFVLILSVTPACRRRFFKKQHVHFAGCNTMELSSILTSFSR